MTILEEIFAHKRREVARRKQARPMAAVELEAEAAPLPLDFLAAVCRPPQARPRLIAEVKAASPSRGELVKDFDPERLASLYQQNGAAAISVLTDEKYFKGSLADLYRISRLSPRLPLLRKDFVCEPYQIYEGRAAGADAILLIAACLDLPQLKFLHTLVLALGMVPLVEVHNRPELDMALSCAPLMIGINNRNLHDFSVNLETSLELIPLVPAGVCRVAESGIHSRAEVDRLASAGVDAILVGEALLTAPDPAAKVRSLSE
jgi:indole-3-glycerol phosphate synthase